MKFETEGGCIIEMYDSIRDMPRAIYHRLQKYSIQSSNMGSDIKESLVELAHWINEDKKDAAKTKIENMVLAIYAQENDHDFQDMEWGSLVYRVDGEPFDFTEENVKDLIEYCGISTGLLEETLNSVKKNFLLN